MFDHFATLLLKRLRNRSEAASKIQNVFHEGLPNGDLFNYNRWSYLEKKLFIAIVKKLEIILS